MAEHSTNVDTGCDAADESKEYCEAREMLAGNLYAFAKQVNPGWPDWILREYLTTEMKDSPYFKWLIDQHEIAVKSEQVALTMKPGHEYPDVRRWVLGESDGRVIDPINFFTQVREHNQISAACQRFAQVMLPNVDAASIHGRLLSNDPRTNFFESLRRKFELLRSERDLSTHRQASVLELDKQNLELQALLETQQHTIDAKQATIDRLKKKIRRTKVVIDLGGSEEEEEKEEEKEEKEDEDEDEDTASCCSRSARHNGKIAIFPFSMSTCPLCERGERVDVQNWPKQWKEKALKDKEDVDAESAISAEKSRKRSRKEAGVDGDGITDKNTGAEPSNEPSVKKVKRPCPLCVAELRDRRDRQGQGEGGE